MSSTYNNFIDLSNSQFAGYWYNEESSKLYSGTLSLSTNNLQQYINLNFYVYNSLTDSLQNILSDIIQSPIYIRNIKEPIALTYNKDTLTFNISFVCNLFNLFSVDIKHFSDSTYISNVTLFDSPVITTLTPTPTITPTITPTETATPTPTVTPSETITPTPTITSTTTPTPTKTVTRTSTSTPSITPSETITPTPTATIASTPSSTITPTPTLTPTNTSTATPTSTITSTPTLTPSETVTPTPTLTPSETVTPTPTLTPTSTVTPTPTRVDSPFLFNASRGLVFDSTGQFLYVSVGNSVQQINLNNNNSKIVWSGAETSGGYVDANTTLTARFSLPQGLAINTTTNELYIADSGNCVIRSILPGIDTSSNITTSIAGTTAIKTASLEGCGVSAGIHAPVDALFTLNTDIALRDNADGARLYILESTGDRISKIIISTGCKTHVAPTQDPHQGLLDGARNVAEINAPSNIAFSHDQQYIYFTDSNTVRQLSLRDSDYGTITTIAGSVSGYSDNTVGLSALFATARGITVDINNNIYVADYLNHAIRKIENNANRTVTTLVGGVSAGFANGNNVDARLNLPTSIELNPAGTHLYVLDQTNAGGVNKKIRIVDITTGYTNTLQSTI